VAATHVKTIVIRQGRRVALTMDATGVPMTAPLEARRHPGAHRRAALLRIVWRRVGHEGHRGSFKAKDARPC